MAQSSHEGFRELQNIVNLYERVSDSQESVVQANERWFCSTRRMQGVCYNFNFPASKEQFELVKSGGGHESFSERFTRARWVCLFVIDSNNLYLFWNIQEYARIFINLHFTFYIIKCRLIRFEIQNDRINN